MDDRRQPGLFDNELDPLRAAAAARSRARMREIITLVSTTDVPPWSGEMGPYFLAGEFMRAKYYLSPEEGKALESEFNPHYERLFAIWAAMEPEPEEKPAPPPPRKRRARQASP